MLPRCAPLAGPMGFHYWLDDFDVFGENDTARWNPPIRLLVVVEEPVEVVVW